MELYAFVCFCFMRSSKHQNTNTDAEQKFVKEREIALLKHRNMLDLSFALHRGVFKILLSIR